MGQLGNDPKKKTVLLYGHLDGKAAYLPHLIHFVARGQVRG